MIGPTLCGQPVSCHHFACGYELGRASRIVTDEMVERAVAAFWAQDLYEHTGEETRAAMREALVAALAEKQRTEGVDRG